jgi:hypothetical protein
MPDRHGWAVILVGRLRRRGPALRNGVCRPTHKLILRMMRRRASRRGRDEGGGDYRTMVRSPNGVEPSRVLTGLERPSTPPDPRTSGQPVAGPSPDDGLGRRGDGNPTGRHAKGPSRRKSRSGARLPYMAGRAGGRRVALPAPRLAYPTRSRQPGRPCRVFGLPRRRCPTDRPSSTGPIPPPTPEPTRLPARRLPVWGWRRLSRRMDQGRVGCPRVGAPPRAAAEPPHCR